MSPKEYLSQVQRWKRRYETALERIQYIRSMADGVKAIRYDKDRVQSTPEGDQMAEYMVRLEQAEGRAKRDAERYFNAFETISKQIIMISPQMYADVLWLRYIQGKKLWDIAEELNFSYGYTKHLHGLALVEFGKCFPDHLKVST